jgi:hypothetical protein
VDLFVRVGGGAANRWIIQILMSTNMNLSAVHALANCEFRARQGGAR